MSFIQPASVQNVALSIDVTRLSADAAKALASDAEYRLRELIQVRRFLGQLGPTSACRSEQLLIWAISGARRTP
jgi:hypothetical protein